MSLQHTKPRSQLPVLLCPIGYCTQFFKARFTKSLASVLRDHYRSAFHRDLSMLVNGRAAYLEVRCYSINVERLPGNNMDNARLVGSAMA